MTEMTPLLERNEQFAGTYTPVPLPPAMKLVIVTCMDHRVSPAAILGIKLGEVPIVRNAGGRVNQNVIEEIAYVAFLTNRLRSSQGAPEPETLFEIAVLHHTQCGTGFLADPEFRQKAAAAIGVSEEALAATSVPDPNVTVKADVERLLASPLLSPKISVSGHVYDIATGRVSTVLEARHPEPAAG